MYEVQQGRGHENLDCLLCYEAQEICLTKRSHRVWTVVVTSAIAVLLTWSKQRILL